MKKAILLLLVGSSLFAGDYTANIEYEKPSKDSIKKTKKALVWCTNNLEKIIAGKMFANQVKTATEKYYNKVKLLEELPDYSSILGYIPSKNELPYIPKKTYLNDYKGLSYGDIIRRCNSEMISAKNSFFDKQFKPSNIAEKKIATVYSQEIRKAMIEEQKIGKELGYKGVYHGIVDSLIALMTNKIDVKELKQYLLKPYEYDRYWTLTNVKKDYVAYEMYAGVPIMIIVKKDENKQYLNMGNMHNGYYKLIELIPTQLSYQGTIIDTVLPVYEIVKRIKEK
jgi:hypothetical protein